ncbi:hypothetical protein [Streptomyces xanthophaeus]|uniref:hypothetical protein n=1 Tax=Streptomyces xanthophaeus TaxID=67385 RepID=UPI0026495186|nr:hypothetical protein [Streptomyces xanthophaeus]WKD36538.1 hypothetical protein KO717_34460 [Streptomyces xanthophaeus]
MTTFLIAFAMWAVPATALLALLAVGRRRRDRQAQHDARNLAARRAGRPAPSWARHTNRRRKHRR